MKKKPAVPRAAATLLRVGRTDRVRWDKEDREEREWCLRRLDSIEERWDSEELRLFVREVWSRLSRPGFDDWTPRNIRDVAILGRLNGLGREARLARESVQGGGPIWNLHFRHVQQLDEELSTLLHAELRLALRNARDRRKGVGKAVSGKLARYAGIRAFVKCLEATEPVRKARIEAAANRFTVSERTVERALAGRKSTAKPQT